MLNSSLKVFPGSNVLDLNMCELLLEILVVLGKDGENYQL